MEEFEAEQIEVDSAPDPAQIEADAAWGEMDALAEAAADDTTFRPEQVRQSEPEAGEEEEVSPEVAEWQARASAAERQNQGFQQMLHRISSMYQQLEARYNEQRQIDVELAQTVQRERAQARIPDPEQDPRGWLDARLTAHEDVVKARFEEQEQRLLAERQQQQQQAVQQAIGNSLMQAEQEWPEFPDVVRHLHTLKQYEFQAAGIDPGQAGLWLEKTAERALMSGQDPAAVLYQLAVNAGYVYEEPEGEAEEQQPPPQNPQYAARQRRSQEAASRQQPRASSRQPGKLRQSDVENMSDEEIQELLAQGEAGWETLFTPFFV